MFTARLEFHRAYLLFLCQTISNAIWCAELFQLARNLLWHYLEIQAEILSFFCCSKDGKSKIAKLNDESHRRRKSPKTKVNGKSNAQFDINFIKWHFAECWNVFTSNRHTLWWDFRLFFFVLLQSHHSPILNELTSAK